MNGHPGQTLSLEEQLECAKMLRKEQVGGRTNNRNTLRGAGTRGSRGGLRASTRGHGADLTRIARRPTTATSTPMFPTIQDASGQITGNLTSGMPKVVSTTPSTAKDYILPHMRGTRSSVANHQPTSTPPLQNVTNQLERLAFGSVNSRGSAEFNEGVTNAAHVKEKPTHPINSLIGAVSHQSTKEARTLPPVATPKVFAAIQPTSQMPVSEQKPQQYYHARKLSNTSDVDMTGIDTGTDGKPRPISRKHGGISESGWAQASVQSSAVPRPIVSNDLEVRQVLIDIFEAVTANFLNRRDGSLREFPIQPQLRQTFYHNVIPKLPTQWHHKYLRLILELIKTWCSLEAMALLRLQAIILAIRVLK